MAKKLHFTILGMPPRELKHLWAQGYAQGWKMSQPELDELTLEHELPSWAKSHRTRRLLTVGTALILILIWTLALSPLQIGVLGWVLLGLAFLAIIVPLNFSLLSLMDLSKEVLDERLLEMRNSYFEPAYKVVGVLIFAIMALVGIFDVDVNRIWLPAFATYSSIHYLLLGWSERNI